RLQHQDAGLHDVGCRRIEPGLGIEDALIRLPGGGTLDLLAQLAAGARQEDRFHRRREVVARDDRADLAGWHVVADGWRGAIDEDIGIDPDDAVAARELWLLQHQAFLPGRRAARRRGRGIEGTVEHHQRIAMTPGVALPVPGAVLLPERLVLLADAERD